MCVRNRMKAPRELLSDSDVSNCYSVIGLQNQTTHACGSTDDLFGEKLSAFEAPASIYIQVMP